MTAKIIDGKTVSAKIRTDLKRRVETLGTKGIKPGLAVVMVGENPASAVYVRNEQRLSNPHTLNACSYHPCYRMLDSTGPPPAH
jgi:methylenetetrahydrofolate dehydrogenase (NADP+)/methenyltetrahydrofolate cyclohydrolase